MERSRTMGAPEAVLRFTGKVLGLRRFLERWERRRYPLQRVRTCPEVVAWSDRVPGDLLVAVSFDVVAEWPEGWTVLSPWTAYRLCTGFEGDLYLDSAEWRVHAFRGVSAPLDEGSFTEVEGDLGPFWVGGAE